MSLPAPLQRIWGRAAGPRIVRALINGLVPQPFRPKLWYRQRVQLADFTPAAATTQELDLNVLFPNNTFPEGVDLLEGAFVQVLALSAGGSLSAVTVSLGDTGDPNGLMTASNTLGGGAAAGDVHRTPAAAEYALRAESAFVPTLTIDTTGDNVDAHTTFDVLVAIPWSPRIEA